MLMVAVWAWASHSAPTSLQFPEVSLMRLHLGGGDFLKNEHEAIISNSQAPGVGIQDTKSDALM